LLAQQVADQGLVGVVVSEDLYREDMGYALVMTRHAIIGARKPQSMGDFQAYLGPGSEVTDDARAEARKISEKLMAARDFSVPAGSIGQVLIKRPGMFLGGYVIIKTGLSSYRTDMRLLSVGGEELLQISKTLEDSLRMVVGERLYRIETKV
jgi:hypothetical protein